MLKPMIDYDSSDGVLTRCCNEKDIEECDMPSQSYSYSLYSQHVARSPKSRDTGNSVDGGHCVTFMFHVGGVINENN